MMPNEGTMDVWQTGEALSTLEIRALVKTYQQNSPAHKYTSRAALYGKVVSENHLLEFVDNQKADTMRFHCKEKPSII